MSREMNGPTLTVSILLLLGFAGLMGLWSERNLEFWAQVIKDTPVDVPYWVGLICFPVSVPFNIISEVARFIV